MKETLERAVAEALDSLGLQASGVTVEYVPDARFGDITTNAAMVHAKNAGKNPRALAEEIIAQLGEIEGVEKIEIAGPGFINFTLTNEALGSLALQAKMRDVDWGKNDTKANTKVLVEYTDPNPFKVFHIGHLMANTIGESISRLIEFSGAEIKRANYQGDVGPHVAKAIWGMRKLGIEPTDIEGIGRAYAAGAQAYEEGAKEEIDALNKVIYERSDDAVNALYDAGRQASLDAFEVLYRKLGTSFDFYFFESQTAPIGMEIVQAHPDVFEESDGARVYRGEQDGLHTRVFLTSNGLPTYEAKDLGLLKLKAETWNFDEGITVTANEQNEYFKVMLAAARRVMPELAGKVRHVSHGMLTLPTGKMSSRTGNVISGEELLAKIIDAAAARAKDSKAEDASVHAEQIGVAALKYQILKQTTGKDIVFEEARALSLEGDSGPYVQYTYARARSVIAAAKAEGISGSPEAPQTDEERKVARLVMQFPDVVKRAQESLEPHYIATYIGELASLYNSWYAQERVVGTDAAPRRVALTESVAITLKNALWLLGIQAPERM